MTCNVARRRVVGTPESEGKVYVRCYNDIAMFDMDMLMPGRCALISLVQQTESV